MEHVIKSLLLLLLLYYTAIELMVNLIVITKKVICNTKMLRIDGKSEFENLLIIRKV